MNVTDNQFLISIDRSSIEQETVLQILNRIWVEHLVSKANFDVGIEKLGEEIKANWWDINKERLLNPEK